MRVIRSVDEIGIDICVIFGFVQLFEESRHERKARIFPTGRSTIVVDKIDLALVRECLLPTGRQRCLIQNELESLLLLIV